MLAVAGIVVEVLTSGTGGQIVAIVLLSVGFGGAVLLVFLEVGLSEDRARAREDAERRRGDSRRTAPAGSRPHSPRWPRRPT